jgi:MOSC domain-containing protein YiiM
MPVEYRLTGRTAGLFLGLNPDSLVTTQQTSVKVDFGGFVGDRHSGLTRKADGRTPRYPPGTEIRNDRQISIVSIEEMALIARRLTLPIIQPEWLGVNLALRGIPYLSLLPPTTHLFFSGGAVIVIQAENISCKHPGEIIQNHYRQEGLQDLFQEASIHLRGLVACVERCGTIQDGEEVEVEVVLQTTYTLHQVENSKSGE